jgi:hypothetical protein
MILLPGRFEGKYEKSQIHQELNMLFAENKIALDHKLTSLAGCLVWGGGR